MIERMKATTFQGNPLTLIGPELKSGGSAPEFQLTGQDLSDVTPQLFDGKILVISVVPSLDTPVCATQTRRFNQEAAALSQDVRILTVSMDLPFAQARFCAAEGISQVITASDYKYRAFGESYGVLIKELGLLARAVFVADRQGKLVHVQYVDEVTHEPDYTAVLDAVKSIQ